MKHDESNKQPAGQDMLPPSNTRDERSILSSFALDRLHVGEVSDVERSSMDAALSLPETQDRLEARAMRFAELEARPDFSAFLDQEFTRLSALSTTAQPDANTETQTPQAASEAMSWLDQLRQWFSWQGMATMAAACAAVVMFALLPPEQLNPTTQRLMPTARRTKGGCKGGCLDANNTMFRVLYFRKGAPYPLWLRHKQALRPGDLIQFSLMVSQEPTHVMIVGMNQRGERYAFVPYQGKRSLKVSQGTLRLPQSSSLELDDYIGPERFYFFASRQPFTLAQVKQAMRSAFHKRGKMLERLDAIPGPWQSRSLLIYKRKR